ncbi:hypothetical protein [Hydrogenophaga defluvii]|uniref:CorA-like Mg2+ transporter protein n=1 Tax=Hydrogenophaga defluvii TaxID=249410 RepID=A0ABW2SEW7_9BURK
MHSDTTPPPNVRHLRQVLLWPLRLMPQAGAGGRIARPWQTLESLPDSPWREVVDEYTGDAAGFHERHYNEFVTFLPFVQRFLYGEGRHHAGSGSRHHATGAAMRVYRRRDVAQARVVPRPGDPPLTLDIAHIDLYFFLDVDVVFLCVELCTGDLPLPQAQDLLYRLGRGYPGGWDEHGQAQHCLAEAEWLDPNGQVLARSDAQQRDLFLAHVCEHRAPRIAAHWAYLLHPLVSDHSGSEGPLRFRQIEYYRMPLMAYLAMDQPKALSREDFVRLALVGGVDAVQGDSTDFEHRYCYDRFWVDQGAAPHTRYLCSGHSLVVTGDAASPFFTCAERGVLAQFRHQHFLLFLIAHFQKAALLMFADRLAQALRQLDVLDINSVRRFKREIRAVFESFLRFTHRYWFHEVAEQAQARTLFKMCAQHLQTDALYAEVRERVSEMSGYLETDSLRRQANTVVRLTVVTIFGLVGTISTGFLGMNLLAEADAPLSRRLGFFAVVFVATSALTVYTMAKSKRLSDFLDALSDEQLSPWQKCLALAAVWKR